MPSPEKIALFGGTFDPPHLAHTAIIQRATELLKLDQVICIPCRQSPHKLGSEPASAAERFEMLTKAVHRLSYASISDIEVKRAGPSYSIDTVIEIRDLIPDAQLFWIMGSDQWEVLETWRDAEKMSEMLEFIVFPRPHTPRPQVGRVLHVVDTRIDISSSLIRERIQNNKDVSSYLAPDVAAFIRDRGLYL